MIIDAHVHIFPDEIAGRTIEALTRSGGECAYCDATLKGTAKALADAGVDLALCLPVVTKPTQYESVNRFAVTVDRTPGFRSFGGIHPGCENLGEKLDRIVSLGLAGVKLHPAYQQTDIGDERYAQILEGCRARGLRAVIHAGEDPAFPGHCFCTPKDAAALVRRLMHQEDEPFIVLAHMGGVGRMEEAERELSGLPVYFDLSFVLDTCDRAALLRFIRRHGAEKILFGTDSPWRSPAKYLSIVESLPLTSGEKDAILGGNAARFLHMEEKKTVSSDNHQ